MVKLIGTWHAIKQKMTPPVLVIIAIAIIATIWAYFYSYNQTIEDTPTGTSTSHTATLNQVSKTNTTVGYVEKEVVDGVKEDTDFEATINQPRVVVKVNGEKQDFKLLQNESRKFEDGKVVLTQTSEVVFDVKVPNKNKLTVYADTHARLNEFHYGIGVEKQNGKFRYGAVYDLKDKEPEFYVRYDLLKVTTE